MSAIIPSYEYDIFISYRQKDNKYDGWVTEFVNEKALESLDKAFNDHEVEMYWLKVEPLFKPLDGDARFENILMKIGFK